MNGNDNAFPSSPEKYEPEFGLTKRELIAAMAMKGMLANSRFDQGPRLVAEGATQYADALIERLAADPVAEGVNLLPMYSRELDEGLTDGK
jgi:hypothetical protein